MTLKERIERLGLKQFVLNCMIHPVGTRPRWWLRLARPLYTQCAWSSIIRRSARMDVVPFNRFVLGRRSVVESFCCINNMVGDVCIGECTRIGIGNTIIGPVRIGNHVNLAQNIVVTALNHNFSNPAQRIDQQGVETRPVTIGDDVWIGANCTILPGVTIGNRVVIAAGSIVTHDVPDHSLCMGAPARVVKQI